ncbi:MAG: histidinol phosphate phosphatase domain-containing protein [Planctomycetes bacterium]|nr:histidinol phosphate phosphatase domain-containing protein [Planctomycetota bacterium]
MIDLHMHTTLSDGELGPAELIRRAEVAGATAIALTDHVDMSTVGQIVPSLVKAAEMENRRQRMLVVPGAELTHVRPEQIEEVAARARELGALLILCHGETITEPVEPGTNRAAIEADVDILAHPGLISEEDVKLAAAHNVGLELTAKKGHAYTNGHVAKLARQHNARLTYGSDAHLPEQIKTREEAARILLGAGLSREEVEIVFAESERILRAKDAACEAKDEPI